MRKNGPLEYLEDDPNQSRDMEDPFHILLLGETYKKPRITVSYVCGSLQFVLEMPYEDAMDCSLFAKEEGMSVLGMWNREQCLQLGKELQQRDLAVRVVPFVQGGNRSWQAKDGDMSEGDFIDVGGDRYLE